MWLGKSASGFNQIAVVHLPAIAEGEKRFLNGIVQGLAAVYKDVIAITRVACAIGAIPGAVVVRAIAPTAS
jgi:hypothetical protein